MSRGPLLIPIILSSLAPAAALAQQTGSSPVTVRWSVPINHVTKHVPSWSAVDVGLAGGFLALLWVDASATRSLARRNWEGFHETNPLIGPRPNEGQINTYTAAVAVATLGIAAALPPKTRRWWLGGAFALEAFTVYTTTARVGVSFSVR